MERRTIKTSIVVVLCLVGEKKSENDTPESNLLQCGLSTTDALHLQRQWHFLWTPFHIEDAIPMFSSSIFGALGQHLEEFVRLFAPTGTMDFKCAMLHVAVPSQVVNPSRNCSLHLASSMRWTRQHCPLHVWCRTLAMTSRMRPSAWAHTEVLTL